MWYTASMSPSFRRRSGFVYATTQHDGWVKLGFTRRCPHRRLKDLSSSNTKDDFELLDAVFVWDALTAEKKIHDALVARQTPQKKEFFQISTTEALQWLDWAQSHQFTPPAPLLSQAPSEDESFDQWKKHLPDDEWVVHSWHDIPASLKSLEKMSAQGHAHASFAVGLDLLQKEQWTQAGVMFRASQDQGDGVGRLYRLFVLSMQKKVDLVQFWEALKPHHDALLKGHGLDVRVEQLLKWEQQSWPSFPERAQSWACFLQSEQNKTPAPRL